MSGDNFPLRLLGRPELSVTVTCGARAHSHAQPRTRARGSPQSPRGAPRPCVSACPCGDGAGRAAGSGYGGLTDGCGRESSGSPCVLSLRAPSLRAFLSSFFFFKISLGILSFTAFSFFFSHFFFFFPFLSSRCCRGYVLLAKFVVPPLRFPHSPHFGSVQCPFVCRHTAGFFCLFFKKIGILWEANGY